MIAQRSRSFVVEVQDTSPRTEDMSVSRIEGENMPKLKRRVKARVYWQVGALAFPAWFSTDSGHPAAVCGNVFASPNPAQVLRGINLVESDAGCVRHHSIPESC